MDWILIHSSVFNMNQFQALCWVLGPRNQIRTISILKEFKVECSKGGGTKEDLQQDANVTHVTYHS